MIRRTVILTGVLVLGWFAGTAFIVAQSDTETLSNIQRQMDQHVYGVGHTETRRELAEMKLTIATNSEQLTLLKGAGGLLGSLLLALNAANLLGVKWTVERKL